MRAVSKRPGDGTAKRRSTSPNVTRSCIGGGYYTAPKRIVTEEPRIIELVINSGRRSAPKVISAGREGRIQDENGLRSKSALDLPFAVLAVTFASSGVISAR